MPEVTIKDFGLHITSDLPQQSTNEFTHRHRQGDGKGFSKSDIGMFIVQLGRKRTRMQRRIVHRQFPQLRSKINKHAHPQETTRKTILRNFRHSPALLTLSDMYLRPFYSCLQIASSLWPGITVLLISSQISSLSPFLVYEWLKHSWL